MLLIDLQTVKSHLRVDGSAEDGTLAIYVTAAELQAAHYADRAFYVDQAALSAAVAAAPAALAAAVTAYDAAMATAEAMDDGPSKDAAIRYAEQALAKATATSDRTQRGMVADDAVRSAVLLIAAQLYENRGEAGDMPAGARALLDTVRAYG